MTENEHREPECGRCGRPTRIFYSEGLTGTGAGETFITPMTYPCSYCAETERFKGMMFLLSAIIDGREDGR